MLYTHTKISGSGGRGPRVIVIELVGGWVACRPGLIAFHFALLMDDAGKAERSGELESWRNGPELG